MKIKINKCVKKIFSEELQKNKKEYLLKSSNLSEPSKVMLKFILDMSYTEGQTVVAKEVRDDYDKWSKHNGGKHLHISTLGRHLKSVGVVVTKGSINCCPTRYYTF